MNVALQESPRYQEIRFSHFARNRKVEHHEKGKGLMLELTRTFPVSQHFNLVSPRKSKLVDFMVVLITP